MGGEEKNWIVTERLLPRKRLFSTRGEQSSHFTFSSMSTLFSCKELCSIASKFNTTYHLYFNLGSAYLFLVEHFIMGF
jgi:hypothetical protein